MCTRYLLLERDYRAIMDRLGIPAPAQFLSRYNIAPNSVVPAVRAAAGATAREAVALRWGLVPAWAKTDEGARLVNARAETLAEKPAFRDAVRRRRCVIPASGFYEWEHRGRARLPWVFRRRDGQPFGFAGLWETWRAPDGAALETCTLVTTTPNELVQPIHNRMPVMLAPEEFDAWLDPNVTDPGRLAPLLRPPAADSMSSVAVSRRVGNVRYDAPDCLAPAEADGDSDGPQLSLGF